MAIGVLRVLAPATNYHASRVNGRVVGAKTPAQSQFMQLAVLARRSAAGCTGFVPPGHEFTATRGSGVVVFVLAEVGDVWADDRDGTGADAQQGCAD